MTDFGRYIAHRGLHGEAVPENSMAAFEAAAQKGLAVELDVRLTKDGKLVVLHDSSLMRVCGVEGEVRDFTAEQLGAFRLNGSGEGIPMFREVLKRINGRVPLLIEIKNCDHGSIEPRVRRILKSYKGSYAVQAFDPRTVLWFRLFAPSVCRGQLISTRRFGSFWEYIARVISASPIVWKYITKPDFIAADIRSLTPEQVAQIRGAGIALLVWTVKDDAALDKAQALADGIIFEGDVLTKI